MSVQSTSGPGGAPPGVTTAPPGGAEPAPEGLVCEVAPDATRPLPRMVVTNGRLSAYIETPGAEVYSGEQVVDAKLADYKLALTREGHGARLPLLLSDVVWLGFMRAGLEEGVPVQDKPYNAKELPEASQALLNACRQVAEAKLILKVDTVTLEGLLERYRFIRAITEAIEWATPVLEANEAQVLNAMCQIVKPAVEGTNPLLDRYPRLASVVARARSFVTGPGEQAAATRADNLLLADAVRADEQAKHLAAAPPAPPTAVVVTPPAVVVATPPAAPATAGLPPKKR